MAVAQRAERELSGLEKAAVLCMVLGAEAAATIAQRLSPAEVEAISFQIARLENASPELAEGVLLEWNETMRAADYLAEGGTDYAREVLEKAFGPQRAQQIFKRIQSQLEDSAGLRRLRKADPKQLGGMFRNEHPQTIALILAHLEPAHTAAVVHELDPDLGGEVLFRMARMEKVSPDILQLIERSLASDTDLSMSEPMTASGGPKAAAEVLNLVPPSMEKQLLDRVEELDAKLAEEIKNLMFVFDDIATLDDRAIQRLLRDVDAKELALAFKGASDVLKERITGAMSQRAVTALNEELEMLGPVRLRDVEQAQAAVVAQVRALEQAGEIVIHRAEDELVIE